ncbi:hypothetical protein [Bacillus sp. MRMR6]|uniref:hypothetical protein n=1 Tax=Bacillus sp. MRMR6 TaxID=1928617 RepID=UPI0009525621|nr:hypothetical protein [Bacillus sp. MRMR6]OLS39248.1 hypothetical protein BTR25_12655 [Bacillus sp. MRMR6]
MKVYVSVKQAGRRKAYLTKEELILTRIPTSLRELITEVITGNVAEYNKKAEEHVLLKYLSFDDIENEVQAGKVGFGERFNTQQADSAQAVDTTMTAFTDGLFRVFVGDQEISTLDGPLEVKEADVLTFIRFTMLAGRMW